jgi:hypothetical protein
MDDNERFQAWFKSLDWPTVGPKLFAALENIDWALSAKRPKAAAQKIIERVWNETGRATVEAEISRDLERREVNDLRLRASLDRRPEP